MVDKIKNLPNCKVHSPSGYPVVEKGHLLPGNFYKICGGIDLYIDRDYGITIVSPKEFVIIGEKAEYDISSNWYIIGRDTNYNYLTIDLNKSRLSRCYDSNWDIHGVAGSCPIIANSYIEVIERLIINKGNHWYDLQDDFPTLGDAYDE
ncbi:SMI1/KNR4 family protein [Neobacillus sp. SuZ13]|uniref:SMI1/KNR4 family protein n=1 Tax=Neobacillus sp. SuZ13 TaxID=3047875 RepID=UPI0024BFFEBC|nr:SMI1/KNR4 family protein [Neobacillus sp. SuZ13]WHY69497.1 SMI1/KNR4 family protein [Neobacillus sp. SuZ13]